MAESSDFARRVFIEDVRSDGKYLRMTWHPELPGFIVSNWDGDVCVGATRVPVDAAPKLVQLLTNGLADACSHTEFDTWSIGFDDVASADVVDRS